MKATLQLPPPCRTKQNRYLTVFGRRRNLREIHQWPERSEAGCFGLFVVGVFLFLLGFFVFFNLKCLAPAGAQLNCINISKKQPAPWHRSSQPGPQGARAPGHSATEVSQSSFSWRARTIFTRGFSLTKCQKRARGHILSFSINLKPLTLQSVGFTLFKP